MLATDLSSRSRPIPTPRSLAALVGGGLLAVAAVSAWVASCFGWLPGVLVGAVCVIVMVVWLGHSVTKPLETLARIAEGGLRADTTPGLPSSSVREVQRLAEAVAVITETTSQQIGALTSERNQANAVVESMAEGVIAVDRHGLILLMNSVASLVLGVPAARRPGQSVFEMIRQQEIHTIVRSVLDGGRRVMQEVTVFQPKERTVRVHGVPCDGGSTGPCAVLVLQDMTESHHYEQLRKEFVANVSHELKSPLTSIRSLTETLLDGAVDDPANNRRFVRLIDEDAARLTRLIDDLLALSQIESQAVPLKLTAVELEPLVRSIVASLQPSLTARRLTVSTSIPPGLSVKADPDRLRQVFVNLLDNAIKYNHDGGRIEVSAASDHGRATIAVTDTGIGIPAQDLSRIFERFYRVDKARSRALGGTGLGLSIVKHIIEAHGGMVSVDSRLQHGSTFSVSLPLQI